MFDCKNVNRGILNVLACAVAVGTFLPGPQWVRADQPRPYQGRETGINVQQDFAFPLLTIGIHAEGHATIVGPYEGQGTVVLNVMTGAVEMAHYTSTARNGDQLFAALNSTPIGPRTLLVQGTITGGTGRFNGASGQYEFLLQYAEPANVLPNSYVGQFEGWIQR